MRIFWCFSATYIHIYIIISWSGAPVRRSGFKNRPTLLSIFIGTLFRCLYLSMASPLGWSEICFILQKTALNQRSGTIFVKKKIIIIILNLAGFEQAIWIPCSITSALSTVLYSVHTTPQPTFSSINHTFWHTSV